MVQASNARSKRANQSQPKIEKVALNWTDWRTDRPPRLKRINRASSQWWINLLSLKSMVRTGLVGPDQ